YGTDGSVEKVCSGIEWRSFLARRGGLDRAGGRKGRPYGTDGSIEKICSGIEWRTLLARRGGSDKGGRPQGPPARHVGNQETEFAISGRGGRLRRLPDREPRRL